MALLADFLNGYGNNGQNAVNTEQPPLTEQQLRDLLQSAGAISSPPGAEAGLFGTPAETASAASAYSEKPKNDSLQSQVHDAALADLIQGVSKGAFAGSELPQAPMPLSPQPDQSYAQASAPQGYGQGVSQFTPNQLPASQPAPAAQAAKPSPDYKTPGIMDRLAGFTQAFSEGRGLVGGVAQAFGGQSPQLIEQQNETYKALVAKGMEPSAARAAVLNPEVLKAILPNVFTPKAPATQVLKEGDMLVQNNAGPDGVLHPTNITPGGGDAMQGKTVQGRLALAPKFGLVPGTPAYVGYVLNGKVPDVTPDHKAIGDADNQVLQSKHLIEDLNHALQLSSQAYSGPAAETRGYITSQLPGSHPDALATNEYANLISSSILPALKSTFPGRVTNADLKLMMELQGSASYAQPVRESIVRRGIARAQEIMAEKQAQADALRGGGYYKPGGNAGVPSQPRQNLSIDQIKSEAQKAIEQGADPEKVLARIRQMSGGQ